MRNPWPLWLAGCVAIGVLVPGVALARVEDGQQALPPGAAAEIETALGRIAGEDFDVVFVKAPPEGVSAFAEQLFRGRMLGDRQGLLVVDASTKQMGAFLGASFTEQGITGQVLANRIAVAFTPSAEKGDFKGGVEELVRQLKIMRATGAAAPSAGFPWWLLLLVPLGVGLAHGIRRWRHYTQQREDVRYRLGVLKSQLARLAPAPEELARLHQELAALPPGWDSARFAGVDAAFATETKGLKGRWLDAQDAFAAGQLADAAAKELELEYQVFLVEAGLATLRATYALLLAEESNTIGADELLATMQGEARRWQDLRAVLAHLEEGDGSSSVIGLRLVSRRLAEIRSLLIQDPPRVTEAAAAMATLEEQLGQQRQARVVVKRVPAAPPRQAGEVWDFTPMAFTVITATQTTSIKPVGSV